MASESGKGGLVKHGGSPATVGAVRNWKLKRGVTIHTWGDSSVADWNQALAGRKNWSGTFEMNEDPPFEQGDAVALQLLKTATVGYEGNAIIGDIDVECDIDTGAPNKWIVSFTGNGALTDESGA